MGGQGKGIGKMGIFIVALMIVGYGALALKRGWISEGWAITLALAPMFTVQVVMAFVLDIRHKHWGWWLAPFLGWGGIWLTLEGLYPKMGFFSAVTQSWSSFLTGGLGSIAVFLSFGLAALMTMISRQQSHSIWTDRFNRLIENLHLEWFKIGGEIINGMEVDYRGDEGNRSLTARDLARLFPARDANGNLKRGWVFGVAACPKSQSAANTLIGQPDITRPQISEHTGETIRSDQGKPTYCVKAGTATAELLIFDPVERDTHLLLCGETGGGKTSCFVHTSILLYPHSLIVGDPKTEAWMATVDQLLADGWTVVHLNPKRDDTYSIDVLSSVRLFNPSMLTELETLAADLIAIDKNAGDGQFFKVTVRKTFKGGVVLFKFDWFMAVRKWLEAGKEHGFIDDVDAVLLNRDFIDGWLLYGLVKKLNTIRRKDHIKKAEWFAKLGTEYVIDGLNTEVDGFHSWLRLAPKHPTLDKVVRWMKKPFDQLQVDFKSAIARGNEHIDAAEAAGMEPNGIILSMVGDLSGWEKPDPATAGNYSISVNTDLAFMNNPAVSRMLCGGTRKIVMPEEVLDGKHRVFINIDSNTIRANPGSVKLIYAAIGFAVTSRKSGKLPQGMTLGMLIDEMPQLRNFDLLHKTWLQEGRGQGFRIMGIIQTAQGLDDMTGEKTFNLWRGVSGAMSIFGIGDTEEAEKLEKIAGTFKAIITNDSGSKGTHSLDDGGPANLSSQREDQKVFSASRILKMKKYEQFLFVKGEGATICAKSPYYLRPEFEGKVNPNEKADPAFPQIEELYAEIELPEMAGLLVGGSEGVKPLEIAQDDIRVKIPGGSTEEETRHRKQVFKELGGTYFGDPKNGWFIPKGKPLAPFKNLDFVTFVTEAKASTKEKAEAKPTVTSTKFQQPQRKCPECGAFMKIKTDRNVESPTHTKAYFRCDSCDIEEFVDGKRQSLGEAQAAKAILHLGIPDADKAKADSGLINTKTKPAKRKPKASAPVTNVVADEMPEDSDEGWPEPPDEPTPPGFDDEPNFEDDTLNWLSGEQE